LAPATLTSAHSCGVASSDFLAKGGVDACLHPKLQTSGGLCYFFRDHLGYPIPSPALFTPMHTRLIDAIKTFASTHEVPLIAFERGQRNAPAAARS
jgi:hypothetical protein